MYLVAVLYTSPGRSTTDGTEACSGNRGNAAFPSRKHSGACKHGLACLSARAIQEVARNKN